MHILLLAMTTLVGPRDVLEITSDTTLDPAKTYGRIVIAASDVTVDGRGAWLVGATEGEPSSYEGVAIEARGVSRVTLRNVNAKGWETGLSVAGGAEWTVEGCDFSDNFHDPSFGWGENGRRGGIVLERVTRSVLRKNRANRVWDACVLVDSDDNTIEENDFSHTSNTCLKLWTSSRNTIRKNDLSWGLRISPGEVHARDSTCVLVESGSDDNLFQDNDCTHGGDGIFVRVLNGWVSTGNRYRNAIFVAPSFSCCTRASSGLRLSIAGSLCAAKRERERPRMREAPIRLWQLEGVSSPKRSEPIPDVSAWSQAQR